MGGRLRVLIIDDDALVVRALRRGIGTKHDVVDVCDGEAALTLFDRDRAFDVVLCDLSLPGMAGHQLYDAVAERYPALVQRFVILTGGATTDAAKRFLERLTTPLLAKPVGLKAIEAVLGSARGEAGAAAPASRPS